MQAGINEAISFPSNHNFYSLIQIDMKRILVVLICALCLSACSVFKNNKTGCGTNGKNVGAEKLVSGDKRAMKAAGKAKKFKA
jgi:hypothetical protein